MYLKLLIRPVKCLKFCPVLCLLCGDLHFFFIQPLFRAILIKKCENTESVIFMYFMGNFCRLLYNTGDNNTEKRASSIEYT